jgi:hypothetical protein
MKSAFHHLCLATLVLGLFSGLARADLVSTEATAFDLTADLTAVNFGAVPSTRSTQTARPLASQPLAADGAVTSLGIGSLSFATPSTLSLWTFITSIRAQQQGDRFSLLETHVSLLQLAESPAAPVPLPGALWFMVVGLMGLVGVRASGSKNPAGQDRQPALAVM